jgi:hypothetical protein
MVASSSKVSLKLDTLTYASANPISGIPDYNIVPGDRQHISNSSLSFGNQVERIETW